MRNRVEVARHVGIYHVGVPGTQRAVHLLLGLGVQRFLEPPELRWSCEAHANLPPLGPSKHTPNQGAFPPDWFCCPAGANGTVRPSDTQRCLCLKAEARAATPRSAGSPVL